ATGYPAADVLGKSPRLLQSGLTPVEVYQDLWTTILRGDVWRGELRNRTRSGELVWHSVAISPIRGDDGVITHFLGVQEDVTRYKKVIQTLDERDQRFRQLAENIREVFFVVTADFSETVYINQAYEIIWGRPVESVYRNPRAFMDAVEPEDREGLQSLIARNQRGETPDEVEFRVRRPDGEVRTVLAHAAPVLNERGEVYRIIGVVMDVTERRHAEDTVREREAMFRNLIEASFHGIVVTENGRITEVNQGMTDITGYATEELIGRPSLEVVAEESLHLVAHRIEARIDGNYDLIGRHKDGHRIQLEATARTHETGGVVRRVTALRDVTETRLLEEQFRRAQKMEAVGRLAGGVAHDFNNLLTVITSYAQMLQQDLSEHDPRRSDLDEVLKASHAAARLTRQLLAFSRRQVLEPRLLEIEESVTNAEKLLRRVIGEDVTLVTVLNPEPARVKIDPGQLEQVIMNLAVNARDAMPQGGRLTIETATVSMDETYIRGHWPATPGDYVMLAVSDTGIGMDQETQAQIFEPFFTTKETGKGTGLGLSTVYGIVKQSAGFIWVYSEPGHGTTFKIYLPRHDEAAAPIDIGPHGPAPGGTETILLTEDDPAVRNISQQILERQGYTVLPAAGADAALRIAAARPDGIDMLLTDMVMPEISGRDLAATFARLYPRSAILYMSGYTDDAVVRHGVLDSNAAYLQKPFSPDTLARKVRQVLDAR
ncbi:MAG: PAS domain S-box protein, partial [Gemmatimonadales bacterium]